MDLCIIMTIVKGFFVTEFCWTLKKKKNSLAYTDSVGHKIFFRDLELIKKLNESLSKLDDLFLEVLNDLAV